MDGGGRVADMSGIWLMMLIDRDGGRKMRYDERKRR